MRLLLLVLTLWTLHDAEADLSPVHLNELVGVARTADALSQLLGHQGTRVKRSIGSQMRCMHRCLGHFKEMLEREGLEAESQSRLLNRRLYSSEAFEDYCKAGLDAKDCFQDCLSAESLGEGTEAILKQMFKTAFKAVDFLCVEHREEFEEALPCMESTATEIAERCEEDCGNPSEASERIQRRLQGLLLSHSRHSMGEMGKMLEEQCRFIRCTLKCESRIMMRTCESQEPALLLNSFVSVAMSSVEEVLEKIPGGRKFWPPTCRRLGRRPGREHSPQHGDSASPASPSQVPLL